MLRKGFLAAVAVMALSAGAALAQSTGNAPDAGAGAAASADNPASAGKPWRHLAHWRDPAAFAKNMCLEHYARSAARLAYLEARLELTPAQKPLWDKWAGTEGQGNAALRDDCLASIPAKDKPMTALDRDSRREKLLEARLDTLKAARPSLEALYQSLTPEQRAAFDRGMAFGRPDGHRRWHGSFEAAPL